LPSIGCQKRESCFNPWALRVPEVGICHGDLELELSRPSIGAAIAMASQVGRDNRQGERKKIPSSRWRFKLLLTKESIFYRRASTTALGLCSSPVENDVKAAIVDRRECVGFWCTKEPHSE
jgi:hypothetical protein